MGNPERPFSITLVSPSLKKMQLWEFPGGLVVRIWRFHSGSIPGQQTEIPQAARCGQKKTNKQKGNSKAKCLAKLRHYA